MGGAREAALAALEKCRRAGAWSDAVLGSVMNQSGLQGRDRAMASAICYGVMQNVYLLDYYINCYSSIKSAKLEPKVLDILRASAYQLLFMDRIPVSAAVNEGVKLCRAMGYARAAGLVNAVLRRIAENREHLPVIEREDFAEELSIRYSCPRDLVLRFLELLGREEAEQLLKCQNESVPTTVQTNLCRSSTEELLLRWEKEGTEVSRHPYLPDCLLLRGGGDVSALPGFAEGLFYVQDAAAKMSVLAAGVSSGQKVLDVCSAPGGKSFAAAVLTADSAEITSCDIHENKLKRIRDGAKRLGLNGVQTQCADGRKFQAEWAERFSLVITDVPCSGLGVIRKKPDIRYKDPAEFARLPEIQWEIIHNAASYVAPGGVLLYSTCTVLPEENEAIAEKFLQQHKDFCAEEFTLPGDRRSHKGMLQLWPHRDGTDGFFIAKFRRKT